MRRLAELAMRGPKQATLLAVFFACTPLLFWLSAATVALVILRQGLQRGCQVLMWALLPGIAWAAMGQYSIVMGLLVTTSLAVVLRTTVSWNKVLLALLPAGGVIATVLIRAAPLEIDQLANKVVTLLQSLPLMEESLVATAGQLDQWLYYSIIGLLTWFELLSCVLGLIIARAWQSWLYYPGAFRDEFHRLRLPVAFSLLLLALTITGFVLSSAMIVLVPIASLPLFIAGLALMHGWIGSKAVDTFWLVVFYALMVLFTQLAYPITVLAACLDSVFNFRQRVVNNAKN